MYSTDFKCVQWGLSTQLITPKIIPQAYMLISLSEFRVLYVYKFKIGVKTHKQECMKY